MRPFPKAGLWLALCSLPAAADLFNNKIVLVGDKGAALGGAFAGLADDATATFYNPAGLTQIKNIKLNVSAQVVQYQMQKIGIAEGIDIPFHSFNFSPTITAFSQRMGDWAYGFSIVTPQNDMFAGEQDIEAAYRETTPGELCYEAAGAPLPCYASQNLSYYDVSKTTLFGPSGAVKFSEDISLGFTLYGIYYAQLEKTAYGGWNAGYVGGDGDDLARFRENSVARTVNQTGLGLTGSFGMLVRMSRDFSFGVNASPGRMVWIDRSEEQRVEFIDADTLAVPGQDHYIATRAQVYNETRSGRHTEISAPALALAVSWRPATRLLLAAQTDYHLGSIYSYTGFTPEEEGVTGRSGFEVLRPVEKRYTITKKSVVNFSGGADVGIIRGYSLALGGYTDFSQGPDEDRPSSWDRNINYYGLTVSVGMDRELTESRFGAGMAYGDASMTHFQWVKTAGGQPILQREIVGGVSQVARIRRDFRAYSFCIFLSSTLKI